MYLAKYVLLLLICHHNNYYKPIDRYPFISRARVLELAVQTVLPQLDEKPLKMDKSMLGDLDALPEEDKQRMSAMIDQLQIRDR